MFPPRIAIINFSSKDDQEVQDVIRSVNRQITEDFAPIWGAGRVLKLFAPQFEITDPDSMVEEKVRAESVLYIVDQPNIAGALGYHSINAAELPVGFVFEDLGDWTVTLSHEALELIVDPTVNIFVPGPDPRDPSVWVFHAYEVCDAVEATTYTIDNVEVSNFVTPQYFSEGDAPGTRNDFLGVGVPSFGVTEGSHLGVINPASWNFETILGRGKPQGQAFLKRYEKFCRKKHDRPDDKLMAALESYNERPPSGCHRMETLTGLTRLSRYQAAAARFKGKYGR